MRLWQLLVWIGAIAVATSLLRDAQGRGILAALIMLSAALGAYGALGGWIGKLGQGFRRTSALAVAGALVPLVSVGSAWLALIAIAALERLVGVAP